MIWHNQSTGTLFPNIAQFGLSNFWIKILHSHTQGYILKHYLQAFHSLPCWGVQAVYKRHQLLGIIEDIIMWEIETHLCGNRALHESSGRQSADVAPDDFEAQRLHRLDEEAMEVGSTPAAHHLHNQLLPLRNVARIDVQSFDARCWWWFGVYFAIIIINVARAWQIHLSCCCCCCCFVNLMMIHHHRLNNAFEGGRCHGWGHLGSADLLHRLLMMNHHGGCRAIINHTSRIRLQVMLNWSTR